MSDQDIHVAVLLDRLVPEPKSVKDDWPRILADAECGPVDSSRSWRMRFSHRRRLVAGVGVATVGLLIPLIAFATANGWWFQRKTAYPLLAKPVKGTPSIIASGQIHGQPWTAVAYISKRPGNFAIADKLRPTGGEMVCVTVILGSLSNQPRGTSCGVLRGMSVPLHARPGSWITYLSNDDPAIITGAVASGVARLEFVLNAVGGRKARTRDVPLKSVAAVSAGIRFFALPYPVAGYDSIAALDKSGKVLQRLG